MSHSERGPSRLLGARYERHRPERTTLYRLVQDNVETLYDAVDSGAVGISLPEFVRNEFESYLGCGLLCGGFARLQCGDCEATRLVAWSCKGRGWCPSCLGRRMASTAANLVENVLAQCTSWLASVSDSSGSLGAYVFLVPPLRRIRALRRRAVASSMSSQ